VGVRWAFAACQEIYNQTNLWAGRRADAVYCSNATGVCNVYEGVGEFGVAVLFVLI
jgi:hypothetical protein